MLLLMMAWVLTVLAIINKAAVNNHLQSFVGTYILNYVGKIPRSGMAELSGRCAFHFLSYY